MRIDADVDAALKAEGEVKQDDYKDLIELVKKHLVNKDIAVKADKLKTQTFPRWLMWKNLCGVCPK